MHSLLLVPVEDSLVTYVMVNVNERMKRVCWGLAKDILSRKVSL